MNSCRPPDNAIPWPAVARKALSNQAARKNMNIKSVADQSTGSLDPVSAVSVPAPATHALVPGCVRRQPPPE
ncbi:hypothetical protein BLAT2472_20198 [Burkholderia latens]